MFDNHVVQVIVTAIGPDVFVGIRAVGCFGARHRRLFRVYDRTVRVLNGFIGVGIDTEQYVFVAGIIAIFYSVDYRAVAGGEGDKASLLACIYLVPFFIGLYIGGISIGDDEISYGISCREFGGDITVFVLIQKFLYSSVWERHIGNICYHFQTIRYTGRLLQWMHWE